MEYNQLSYLYSPFVPYENEANILTDLCVF